MITQYDADLGWTLVPNLKARHVFGSGLDVISNTQGFRSDREYSRSTPEGKYRIIVTGDSFTFGHGVGNRETFPAFLEQGTNIETINMGMMAYGIDQAYLRYLRDGASFEHDMLMFGIITDDFRRLLLDRGGRGHDKPVIAVNDGRINVTNVPARRPRARESLIFPEERRKFVLDYFASTRYLARLIPKKSATVSLDDPPKTQSIAQAIFADLAERCRKNGSRFVIVWLPTHAELLNDAARKLQETHKSAISRFSGDHKISFVDLTGLFEGYSEDEIEALFLEGRWRHPNAKAHGAFAREILRQVARIDDKITTRAQGT